MSEEIITAQHRAFARAVVEAARRHGMYKFSATINFTASHGQPRAWHQVEMHWSNGRHGVGAPIEIKLMAQETITEQMKEEDAP
jgi:hypothetical protein